ncbi:hypothetical protein RHGRI_000706 [Rhododendron griersonianum]|uniref:Uncharacterized protein n=1 Tax=Rhododendron griersonianum TaxID=479676 RepID=A0AAV6LK44_9ERIC|nr:hypothetical protein RHGRI_000706 [Rhododendron griersonianum]
MDSTVAQMGSIDLSTIMSKKDWFDVDVPGGMVFKESSFTEAAEKEDDEVDNTDDDRVASSKKEEHLVDDMEKQRNDFSDDKVEEDEKGENSDDGSHQSGLGKEPIFEKPPFQEKTVGDMARGNNDLEGRNNEESINSVHGLDSIVQDSQTPLNEDCLESVNNSSSIQNTEIQKGFEQEQERERVNEEDNIPVVYEEFGGVRIGLSFVLTGCSAHRVVSVPLVCLESFFFSWDY